MGQHVSISLMLVKSTQVKCDEWNTCGSVSWQIWLVIPCYINTTDRTWLLGHMNHQLCRIRHEEFFLSSHWDLTVEKPCIENTCQRCHIAYPPKAFPFSSCKQATVYFSQRFWLSTLWQILMSLECLSGHPIALFTVYTYQHSHPNTVLKVNEAFHRPALPIPPRLQDTGAHFSCLLHFHSQNGGLCIVQKEAENSALLPVCHPSFQEFHINLACYDLSINCLSLFVQFWSCSLLAAWLPSQHSMKEILTLVAKTDHKLKKTNKKKKELAVIFSVPGYDCIFEISWWINGI